VYGDGVRSSRYEEGEEGRGGGPSSERERESEGERYDAQAREMEGRIDIRERRGVAHEREQAS